MKKTLALIIAALLITAIFATLPVSATEDFQYVRLTAEGNDPYGSLPLSDTINPDEVKYAAIKYRTVSQYDNTNVEFVGQFYIEPAAEPFIPIIWKHSQQWETIVVDMTTVSQKTELESLWTSASYSGATIRFDPLESNRDAEANDSEADEAVVSEGDCIDIAFIAFFANEADAKAYTGVEDTPAATISIDDLEWMSGNKVWGELRGGSAATVAPTTQAPETNAPVATDAPATQAPAATDAPATQAPAATDAPGTDAPSGGSEDEGGFPAWAWIIIGVAAVGLVVVIVVAATQKKK